MELAIIGKRQYLRLWDTVRGMVRAPNARYLAVLNAPDYGYKRRSTNREALHRYTQPEGMGYLAQVMFYGRSNFGNL